jgi:hypothetical protein
VYLGTRVVAACTAGGPVAASRIDGVAAAMDFLQRWSQEQPRPPKLRIWLSGGLCRPFMLPRIAGSSAAELEKIAVSLVPEQIGWFEPVTVRVDMQRNSGQAVAVAVKSRTLDELRQALGTPRREPVSIQPWWAEVLRISTAKHPHAQCLAVQDCDSVCVIAGEGPFTRSASVVTPIEDRTAAEAAIARLRFTQGISSPPLLARLNIEGQTDGAAAAGRAFDRLLEWCE